MSVLSFKLGSIKKNLMAMPKDLLIIILGAGISGAYFYWQDYKRKQKEKQQERLNQIK